MYIKCIQNCLLSHKFFLCNHINYSTTICFILKRKLISNLRVTTSVLPCPASTATSYVHSTLLFLYGTPPSLSLFLSHPFQSIQFHWHWPQPHFWDFRRKFSAAYSIPLSTVVHDSTMILNPGTFIETSGKERLWQLKRYKAGWSCRWPPWHYRGKPREDKNRAEQWKGIKS